MRFWPGGIVLAVMALFGMIFGGLAGVSAKQPAGPTYHKAIAPSGSLDGRPGAVLWQDYGTFALYRLEGEKALASLPASARLADDMDRILIAAIPFDTQREQPNIPSLLRAPAPSGEALHLIQFVGPLKQAWLDAVRAAGAIPVHYIANNAYLVWADESARGTLDAWAADKDFLQYSAPYQPYFKLAPPVRARVLAADADPREIVPVLVQIYRHDGAAATEEKIEKLAVRALSGWEPVLDYENIRLDVRAGDLQTLAAMPDVTWIEERLPRQLYDEMQNQILAGHFNADQSGPDAPGYLDWLDSLGFSQNPADYPIVDITDDGIGDGTLNSGDPTFHQFGDIANPSRLAYVGNCTGDADGGGPDGHGHINTSIVGGYDARSGFPFQDPAGFLRGLGVNPYGRIAGTRIFGSSGYDISACGGTDQGVILQSYTSGARISSNSWGCGGCAGTYDASSQAYDAGTRDADPSASGNQEFLFVFAAGNDGPTSATVGTPGNGKNMVTVGASENDRPSDEDGSWTDGCNIGPTEADNAMDVVSFSSRGPAPGGRVKPEVIAPGTHIQGTASTNPNYNGSSVCDMYRPGGQTTFAASSGTSHSTPAVAGVASLYWYWLENTYGISSPSPALIKAYLMAHTTYLTGVSANDTLPSNNQGYGMPDMSAAFDDTPRYLLNQTTVLDNSGDTWTFDGAVADPSRPVRIVMVYTDKAGVTGTSPQVNDLNLSAEIDGTTYLGNIFSGQWSTTGGSPDDANNYEAIFLPAGTAGALHITVTGFNIADDGVPGYGDATDQDFALVCYNCAQNRDFTIKATPASQEICAPDDAVFDVQVGSILGYADPVTLSADGVPAGAVPLFAPNPVVPAGSSVFTVTNTGAASYGVYDIAVVGIAPTSTHTATVTLGLFTAAPAAPTPLTPTADAINVPIRPTFTWSEPAQGTLYDLEIASDPAFTTLVYTATGLTAASHTPDTDLLTSTYYYWRVRAANTCGTGTYSAASRFLTAAAPGDCSISQIPNILYAADFENGAAGWTHGAETGSDTWTLSGARIHSGSFAFYAQDVASVSDQWLTTPPVTIPAGQSPVTLQFWNHQTIEDRSGGCYDGALVEVSTDGGSLWTQIPDDKLLTDPYDGVVSSSYSNPLAGRQAWCGDPQDWLNSVVDLDAYAGQTVQFRFRLGTDSSVGHEGWYLDDLKVQSCMAPGYDVSLGSSVLTSRSPDVVTHTLLLQNLGLTDAYTLTLTPGAWPVTLLTGSPISVTAAGAAAIRVRVDVPDIVPMLSFTDTFTVTAQSVHSPTVVTSGTGTTEARILPQAAWGGSSARSGGPGETVTHTFTLRNTGNHTDTFTLQTGGNLWPLAVPATVGPLAPDASAEVDVQVSIPGEPALRGVIIATDSFVLTATSGLDGNVSETTTGTTNALVNPAVKINAVPGDQSGLPGETVTYTLTITNSGDYTDTFDLSLSGASWPAGISASTVGPLPAGGRASVMVNVTIPNVLTAFEDSFTVAAVSRLDNLVTASVSRVTRADVVLGVEMSPAAAQGSAYSGEIVPYTLTITNTGTLTDTFAFSLQGNAWQTDIPAAITLGAGKAGNILAEVYIPAEAALGAQDVVTVEAVSGYDAQVKASSILTTAVPPEVYLYLPIMLR